jgi:hypothetical protein
VPAAPAPSGPAEAAAAPAALAAAAAAQGSEEPSAAAAAEEVPRCASVTPPISDSGGWVPCCQLETSLPPASSVLFVSRFKAQAGMHTPDCN